MPHKGNTSRALATMLVTALLASTALAQSQPAVAKSADAKPTVTRVAATPAKSNELLRDLGSAERIQRTGSLRMLSQRISASVCNRAAGLAVADAEKYLKRAVRDYRRIIKGLEHGDDGLGLYGPETDRIVLRDLGKLNDMWAPLDETFQTVANEELTADHAKMVARAVPQMLELSEHLVGTVSAEYSDPSQMLQSEAILMNISERQRKLEQTIANATCMIGEGIDVPAAQAMMTEAMGLYDVSLEALRFGRPELGVAAAPTQAIELWLGDIKERWDDVRPTMEKIAAEGVVSDADRTFVYEEMNKLTWMMNVTVGQYTEVAKLKF